MPTTLTVEPYEPPFRYWVRSGSKRDVKHLVDLEEFGGNGQCSCEQFRFRLQPRLAEETARCKHILAARERFTDDCIDAMSRTVGKRRPGAPRDAENQP